MHQAKQAVNILLVRTAAYVPAFATRVSRSKYYIRLSDLMPPGFLALRLWLISDHVIVHGNPAATFAGYVIWTRQL
jgi:hypothetical protein